MGELLRPYGIVIDGELELGLELVIESGVIREIRPHTGIPELYVISPAFINAHSHLEYRGLQGKLKETEYWPWIREIRDLKLTQSMEAMRLEALIAARENVASGVAIIGEHSDRPVAGAAMKAAGIKGVIFQELITRSTPSLAKDKWTAADQAARSQGAVAGVPSYVIPHAYQTVDEETLRRFGGSTQPFSMHVAESDLENEFTLRASGAIADTYRDYGIPIQATGKRLIPTLGELGLMRKGAQFVHCCAITDTEVEDLASAEVAVAHCPRSNERLNCPGAPIREMIDAGVKVGLGLDSPASSGPIDIFAEMRAARDVALNRRKPLRAHEIWRMATDAGANSLRAAVPDLPDWRIGPQSAVPLLKIHVSDAYSTDDLIERSSADRVEWVAPRD